MSGETSKAMNYRMQAESGGLVRRVLMLIAATIAMCAGILPATTGSAVAASYTYGVANTSEYPPDGVYFRSAPDWNTPIKVAGMGVYAGDQVHEECWQMGTNVPRRDGGSNLIWLHVSNVTRPTVAGRANVGWLNGHFINDGAAPNHAPAGVPQCSQPVDWQALTDKLLFQDTLWMFLSSRAKGGGQLDWSSDLCSAPTTEPQRSQPLGFDFRGPCERHDFGYRNYKKQGRFTETNRKRIDDNFHNDLYTYVCADYTGLSSASGVLCRRIADIYYNAVRACGASVAPACLDPIFHAGRLFA
jgi:hypothetical protein